MFISMFINKTGTGLQKNENCSSVTEEGTEIPAMRSGRTQAKEL